MIIQGRVVEIAEAMHRLGKKNLEKNLEWNKVVEMSDSFFGSFKTISAEITEEMKIIVHPGEEAITMELLLREPGSEWIHLGSTVVDRQYLAATAADVASFAGVPVEEVMKLPWFTMPGQMKFIEELQREMELIKNS